MSQSASRHNDVHPYQKQIDLCNSALEAVRLVIPEDLYSEVSAYVNRHDEWAVGIEALIDGLTESEIRITTKQFALIEAAVFSIGLGASWRIQYLRRHNVII